MVRCKGKTLKNRRCKNNAMEDSEFCCVHDFSTVCGICEYGITKCQSFTLEKCGHSFCKTCFDTSFMEKQWHESFSTFNDIYCFECNEVLCDDDYQKITERLCTNGILYREIIYDVFLCAQELTIFSGELNKSYIKWEYASYIRTMFKQLKIVNYSNISDFNIDKYYTREKDPTVVYFHKKDDNDIFTFYDITKYVFKYQNPFIKLNESFYKELVEYVYHPSRMTPEKIEMF